MKRLFPLLLVAGLYAAFTTPEDINEILRRKVEMVRSISVKVDEELIHCTAALPRFYEERGFESVWTNIQDSKRFLAELKKAGLHGLNPNDYHLDAIETLLQKTSPSVLEEAELDLLMTDAFLLYASHLISGKVDPETIDPEWHVRKDQADAVELLNAAIADGYAMELLTKHQPKSNTYRSLQEALKTYQGLANKGGWETVPSGESIKPATSDDRIPMIRARLVATNDLPADADVTSNVYDDILKEGVVRFQKRHGLDSDGVIGKKTIDAMNVSAEHRANQILANLERWRWLNQEMSPYRIMVNIADYKLMVIKDAEVLAQHNVMVGKPYRRTPVFQSTMQYFVVNPTWTVPPTILRNDIIPAVRKNPDYLAGKGIQVLNSAGAPMDPSTIDWSSSSVYSYTYRQPAGKSNALGAVKFMFPNSFNVYIHDTPSKEQFGQAERAFSSGCIRVQNPIDLAKLLVKDQAGMSAAGIDQVVKSGQTQTISLTEKPAVYILYWTAWTDSSGSVQFRTDVYERDMKLINALKVEDPQALASAN